MHTLRCLVVLTPLLLVGCSNQLKTYPIEGRVEFENGRPVVMGLVECQSIEHSLNARGEIQPDGSFELKTFEDGDGAVAGTHKCVVIQMVIGENMSGYKPSTVGVVDPMYASYRSSGLTMVVDPDAPNKVVLKVRGVERQPAEGADHEHEHGPMSRD